MEQQKFITLRCPITGIIIKDVPEQIIDMLPIPIMIDLVQQPLTKTQFYIALGYVVLCCPSLHRHIAITPQEAEYNRVSNGEKISPEFLFFLFGRKEVLDIWIPAHLECSAAVNSTDATKTENEPAKPRETTLPTVPQQTVNLPFLPPIITDRTAPGEHVYVVGPPPHCVELTVPKVVADRFNVAQLSQVDESMFIQLAQATEAHHVSAQADIDKKERERRELWEL